jgi:L-alanine-DL-glutamate epimerase-like enolase superfamily enzyme
MKITKIDCHVLLAPNVDVGATSSAQDDIVVEIHTDEGISGIGESDVSPWIARACIEAQGTHTMGLGLAEMLLGQDPLDVEGLWEKLYVGSAMNGRRGALIHALGALDIALHDLRGKALGKPCYELLGGAAQQQITPYASLLGAGASFEEYRDSMVQLATAAQRRGFSGAKLELIFSGPYAHGGLHAPDTCMTEAIAAVRAAVGPAFVLMVDVGYAFPDAETCLRTIRDWAGFELFFLETPLPSDDLDGYARLARAQPIPIAAGEWLATRFEFVELMDRGLVGVAQPDVGRVGGLTEARRVCALAGQRRRQIVPHAWKTGISIAAAAHLAAATPHCPYIEFLPADLSTSALRRELTEDELTLRDGHVVLPSKPGLGVELNRDALERYRYRD